MHTYEQFVSALNLARQFGFTNINADLIIEEAAALFREFDYHTSVWGCDVDISGGKAVLSLPDNMASYLLFGNKSAFSFTEQDIIKLKDYLV